MVKLVTEKIQCVKIDKFYFRDPKGRIRKYLQFCRRKNCKTESSYNFENLKPKYCFKHKKEDMVNTKRGHKLCLKCKTSYKTKCTSKKCKYTIQKYKFNSNDIINDINNIENLEKNDEYMKPYLIKTSTDEYDYNIDKMYENLDKVNCIKSGNSITYIHNMGCDIKISECELLRGSSFEKIPKIFYDSKMINIIKNQDLKCFLYCYIRKYLNPVKKHGERVSKIDKEFVKKLEDELNYNFDNVEIKDISKIENLLEINIYVYTCDKNLKNKIPIYKSDKNFKKYLDLLLFENHYMNIKRIDLFFNPNSTNKKYFCRNCCNTFFSEIKYNDHITFCETNKSMILLPSKFKYLQFRNIQNTIQHPFVAFADIESYMIYKNEKVSNHEHLMSGYYLHCLDEKYSKKVQLFDKLEDFRDNLI